MLIHKGFYHSFLRKLSNEFTGKDLYADALLEAEEDGKPFLAHYEFQKRGDAKMALRLLAYNIQAMLVNDELAVYSCVIYLVPVNDVPQSPFVVKLPNGKEIFHFHFEVILLYKIPTEVLRKAGHKGLLPLLPLTREGATHEIIDEVIAGLTPVGEGPETELLALAYGLASLVFKTEPEQRWLKRRFSMLADILKDTWAFREIMEEAHEKGLEEGLQQGLEQGLEKGLGKGLEQGLQVQRDMILDIVLDRFPELLDFSRSRLVAIKNASTLRVLGSKLLSVKTAEEAQTYLKALSGEPLN